MNDTAWDDVERFLRGTALEIVLIVLGTVLAVRAVHAIARRSQRRTEARMERLAEVGITPSADIRQSGVLIQVVEWLTVGTLYLVAILVAVLELGVPLAGLLPTATVLGAALGFGAQNLVKDLLSGFFIISERQFGLGDVIRVGDVGSTVGVAGTVEALTLRTTRMRTIEGELVVIPNGEIHQLTNLSREWSRILIDVKLPIDEDLERVIAALRDCLAGITEDPAWAPLILEAPVVLGVESLDLAFAQIRISTNTQPGQQWAVGRELRQRIAAAMRDLGVSVPATFVAQQ